MGKSFGNWSGHWVWLKDAQSAWESTTQSQRPLATLACPSHPFGPSNLKAADLQQGWDEGSQPCRSAWIQIGQNHRKVQGDVVHGKHCSCKANHQLRQILAGNHTIDQDWKHVHPYAKVLAMFAFDSYSQSKRLPRPLSRHRPCKTPFPTGNTSFNKPWPNYHGSIRFWSNPIGTPVSNGPFFVGTVDAHKQKHEAGPFPIVCILQDGFW